MPTMTAVSSPDPLDVVTVLDSIAELRARLRRLAITDPQVGCALDALEDESRELLDHGIFDYLGTP